jgi:hypothetical protein
VNTCHDTDAPTRFSMNVLLWPVVTPVLWLVESALLFGALSLVSNRWPRIAICVVVVAVLTWLYWAFGGSSVSTGLYSSRCPAWLSP